MRRVIGSVVFIMLICGLTGCAETAASKEKDKQVIIKLSSQVQELEKKSGELEEAKALLESRLQRELKDKEVLLELNTRGLVIMMTNDILFDSGKADLKQGSYHALDEIAGVIKEKLSGSDVGIEGHTDD